MQTTLRAAQTILSVLALVLGALGGAAAQMAAPAEQAPRQEKEYINYGSWETRVKFSQGVSVRNPGRWIFLSGVGSEGDTPMQGILFPGDFLGQCRHAWKEIRSRLERQGASVNDIVRVVTYVTDVRNLAANNACRGEVFGAGPYPPHTFLVISALALPGMLVEVEVTAATSR